MGKYEASVLAGSSIDEAQEQDNLGEMSRAMGMKEYDGMGNPMPLGSDMIPRNLRIQSIDIERFDPMIKERIEMINR